MNPNPHAQPPPSAAGPDRPDWEGMPDADLNRQFARAFWNRPLDERNNTYWHDDDKTAPEENHEWKPLPDFCNSWKDVRALLVESKYVLPIHHGAPQDQHSRCRRAIADMLILDRITQSRVRPAPASAEGTATPRTDTYKEAQMTNLTANFTSATDFARQLERELDEAKRKLFLEEENRNQLAILGHQKTTLESALAAAQKRVEELEGRFAHHTKAVGDFLNELYAIAVDPLADGTKEVSEIRAELLVAARRDRDTQARIATLTTALEAEYAENRKLGRLSVMADLQAFVVAQDFRLRAALRPANEEKAKL